jgi:hypothetical protein
MKGLKNFTGTGNAKTNSNDLPLKKTNYSARVICYVVAGFYV